MSNEQKPLNERFFVVRGDILTLGLQVLGELPNKTVGDLVNALKQAEEIHPQEPAANDDDG